jgi:hypothetical protein
MSQDGQLKASGARTPMVAFSSGAVQVIHATRTLAPWAALDSKVDRNIGSQWAGLMASRLREGRTKGSCGAAGFHLAARARLPAA